MQINQQRVLFRLVKMIQIDSVSYHEGAMTDHLQNYFEKLGYEVYRDEAGKAIGGDHAGKVETSAMMELHPHLVQMERHNKDDWYAETALEASREFGSAYMDAMVDELEKLLLGGK